MKIEGRSAGIQIENHFFQAQLRLWLSLECEVKTLNARSDW
jgi:hypothetical protein